MLTAVNIPMYVNRYPFVCGVKPNFSILIIGNMAWNTPTGIATNNFKTIKYNTSGIARRETIALTLSRLPVLK